MARPGDSAGPRFRPGKSPPGSRRLLVVVGLLAVASLGASALANARRYALVCVDGTIEARRGTVLPGRMKPVSDPLFVPLSVPEQLCRDSEHGSRRALEQAYVETAIASVDAAIAAGSTEDLHRSLASLELLLGAAGDHVETSGLERRHRALLLARLRSEVEQARALRQRAMTRIEQAREAGLDDPLLDQLEQELRAVDGGGAPTRDETVSDTPAEHERAHSEERAL